MTRDRFVQLTPCMTDGKQKWRFGWSTCPGCGSFGAGESLLCGPCEDRVMPKARSGVRIDAEWTHRYLFDWIPGDDTVLSRLLLGLKGRGREKAWRFWARRFLCFHAVHLPALDQLTPYAAPSSSPGDHSMAFAAALAGDLGLGPVHRPLGKSVGFSLRGLDRRARWRGEGFVKNTGLPPLRTPRAVLVDDVLTTGATAHAVKHALSGVRQFEVWTLAARTAPSCEPLDAVLRSRTH